MAQGIPKMKILVEDGWVTYRQIEEILGPNAPEILVLKYIQSNNTYTTVILKREEKQKILHISSKEHVRLESNGFGLKRLLHCNGNK